MRKRHRWFPPRHPRKNRRHLGVPALKRFPRRPASEQLIYNQKYNNS